MNTITKIVYPCTNDTMGDTSASDCNLYREWLAEKFQAKYPGADITVTAEHGNIRVETNDDSDDADLRDELHEFGNRCWDYCPWDFV